MLLRVWAQEGAASALLEGSVANKITGGPIKRAHVMALKVNQAAGTDLPPLVADSDQSGRFSIRVEPGVYRLWADRSGFARQPYGARTPSGPGALVTVAAGQELKDLGFRMIPYGAIAGRVLDEDGEPVIGAAIQILRFHYASGRRQLIPGAGAGSNDRGEYRVYGLPAGRYFMLVTQRNGPISKQRDPAGIIPEIEEPYAPVYYPGVFDFAGAAPLLLPEGGELRDVDFRVRKVRAVTLRGRLMSPTADLISGDVQVILAPREGAGAGFVDRIAGAVDRNSGRFEFRGVAPGSYLLAASQLQRGRAFGGRMALEVTGAEQEDLAVTVAPGIDLQGSIELEDAPADALGKMSARLVPSEGLTLGPQPAAAVGPGGAFQLSGVTPGLWNLVIEPLPEGAWIKALRLGERDVLGGDLNIGSAAPGPLRVVLGAHGGEISGTVTAEGQPRRAAVALVPSGAEARAIPGLYRSTSSDEKGAFAIKGIRPGAYKLFAFEEVEHFAWLDPDFLKSIESLSPEISVAEGERISRQLTPISPISNP
jgi:hypothetical protein